MNVTFRKLPLEIVGEIANRLSLEDLHNCFLVSKAFYEIMKTDTVFAYSLGSWDSVREVVQKNGDSFYKNMHVVSSIFGFVTHTSPPQETKPTLIATVNKYICVAESKQKQLYCFNPRSTTPTIKQYQTPIHFIGLQSPTCLLTLHNHFFASILEIETQKILNFRRFRPFYSMRNPKLVTVHEKYAVICTSFHQSRAHMQSLITWNMETDAVSVNPWPRITALEVYNDHFFLTYVDPQLSLPGMLVRCAPGSHQVRDLIKTKIPLPFICEKLCFQNNHLYTIPSLSSEASPISVFDISNDSIKEHATIPCPQPSRWVSFCPSELFHAGVTSSGRGYLLEAKTYTVSAEIPLGFLSPVDKAKTWIKGESVFFTDYKVIKVYDSRRPKQALLSVRPIAPAKSFIHITDPNPHGYAALDDQGRLYNFSNKALDTHWQRV